MCAYSGRRVQYLSVTSWPVAILAALQLVELGCPCEQKLLSPSPPIQSIYINHNNLDSNYTPPHHHHHHKPYL